MESARVIEVVETRMVSEGDGREIVRYWTLKGELLAEVHLPPPVVARVA